MDTGNGSVVSYGVVTPDAPFVVERDTGEITTAGVFRGLSGQTLETLVRAFDNYGVPITQSTVDILTVSRRIKIHVF